MEVPHSMYAILTSYLSGYLNLSFQHLPLISMCLSILPYQQSALLSSPVSLPHHSAFLPSLAVFIFRPLSPKVINFYTSFIHARFEGLSENPP